MQINKDPTRITQGGENDIRDPLVDIGTAGRRHAFGFRVQPEIGQGNIVRREVPGRIDINPDRTQIGPHHRNVMDSAEFPLLEVLLDAQGGRVVDEHMAHHQNTLIFLSQRTENSAAFSRICHRLFNQNMLPRLKGLASQFKMRSGGRRDHQRLNRIVFKRGLHGRTGLGVGKAVPHHLQAVGVGVNHMEHLTAIRSLKIGDQIWAPMPRSNNCHSDHDRSIS